MYQNIDSFEIIDKIRLLPFTMTGVEKKKKIRISFIDNNFIPYSSMIKWIRYRNIDKHTEHDKTYVNTEGSLAHPTERTFSFSK